MSKPIIDYFVTAAQKLITARSIGGVSFDGSEDIDLKGVNKSGDQDTSGNASTASALKNPVKVTFNGDISGILESALGSAITVAMTHKEILATAGTAGSRTAIPVISFDKKGRITEIKTEALGGTTHHLVNETHTFGAESTKTYNLTTIMGSDASKYDLDGLVIQVLVLDNTSGSPTNRYYINSEAVIVVGVSNTNTSIILHNPRSVSVSAKIRISVGAA